MIVCSICVARGIITSPFLIPEAESMYEMHFVRVEATRNFSHVYKLRFVPRSPILPENISSAIEIQDGDIWSNVPCITICRYVNCDMAIGNIPVKDIIFLTEKNGNLDYILKGRLDIKQYQKYAPGSYATKVAGIDVGCGVY